MKKLIINIQTCLFLDDRDNILGSYNKNTELLVVNNSLATKSDIAEMAIMIEDGGDFVARYFITDSFSISFYDPTDGGTSTFHEVKNKGKGFLLTNFLLCRN